MRRLKSGLSVEQPIAGDELRAIKRHLAARIGSAALAVPVRARPAADPAGGCTISSPPRPGAPVSPPVHPHTLRHACGYYLANRGHDLRLIQDYLGHREPRHTAHYTRVAAHRFEGLWGGR